MPSKPAAEAILRTYSHDELLDLAKAKAKIETEERLSEAQKHLNALNQLVGARGETPGGERMDSIHAAHGFATRPRNKRSLGEHVLDVLDDKPKKIDEILEAIYENGYHSNAREPRRVLYLELKKQIDKGNVKKDGRGLYSLL